MLLSGSKQGCRSGFPRCKKDFYLKESAETYKIIIAQTEAFYKSLYFN